MPHISEYGKRLKFTKQLSLESKKYALEIPTDYLTKLETWKNDLKSNKCTIFNILTEIIEKTLPETEEQFFQRFVEIKEVPYGECNTNSDYRRSGTEFSGL